MSILIRLDLVYERANHEVNEIYLNPRFIVQVISDERGSSVSTTAGKNFICKQTPKEVNDLISKAVDEERVTRKTGTET